MHSKLLVALVALSLCEVSIAQVPHTFSAGTPAKASEVNDNFAALSSQISSLTTKVYFGQCMADRPAPCDTLVGIGDVTQVGQGAFTTLKTLTLPQGSYFVETKVDAYSMDTSASGYNLTCVLEDAATHSPATYAGRTGSWENIIYLQVPVSFGSSGGTVRVGCRALGFKSDGVTPVELIVWSVSISALTVGSVVQLAQ